MFKEPFGRPLIDVVRGVPGVCVPGSVRVSSSRLRVLIGSSTSCLPTRVELTVAVDDWITSAAAVTSMVSLTAPTSNLRLTVAGTAASSLTFSAMLVRNPFAVTVTRYVAAGMEGTAYSPCEPVEVVYSCPVTVF
jgi:hypothetical protein